MVRYSFVIVFFLFSGPSFAESCQKDSMEQLFACASRLYFYNIDLGNTEYLKSKKVSPSVTPVDMQGGCRNAYHTKYEGVFGIAKKWKRGEKITQDEKYLYLTLENNFNKRSQVVRSVRKDASQCYVMNKFELKNIPQTLDNESSLRREFTPNSIEVAESWCLKQTEDQKVFTRQKVAVNVARSVNSFAGGVAPIQADNIHSVGYLTGKDLKHNQKGVQSSSVNLQEMKSEVFSGFLKDLNATLAAMRASGQVFPENVWKELNAHCSPTKLMAEVDGTKINIDEKFKEGFELRFDQPFETNYVKVFGQLLGRQFSGQAGGQASPSSSSQTK